MSGRWEKGKRFDPVTDAQGNRTGWQQVDVKLTPAQEARVVDVFYRDLKATVGFEALWQALADRDDPYSAPDRAMGVSTRMAMRLVECGQVGISLTRHLETRRAHGGTRSLNIEHG